MFSFAFRLLFFIYRYYIYIYYPMGCFSFHDHHYTANVRKRASPGRTKSDHHTAAYVQRHIYAAVIARLHENRKWSFSPAMGQETKKIYTNPGDDSK